MIKKTFTAKAHEEYGSMGFQLKGKPMFEPLMGMTCAHDCLEHFNDDDGRLHQEYMAFGASVLIRGEGGYFEGRQSSVAENYASDFLNLWVYSKNNRMDCLAPPVTRKLSNDFESLVDELEREAISLLQSDCDASADEAKEFVKHVRAWMRIGYRKAQKRYAGVTSCELTYLFQQIEKKIDQALKTVEYEGQEFALYYDPNTQAVRVDQVEEYA